MDASRLRVVGNLTDDPVFNIALEEALHLSAEETGEPSVRIWWADKAVVLGNSRKVDDDVFLDACRADGIPVIRRHSGGGTVYIHPDVINFTLIIPYIHPDIQPLSRIRESNTLILKPLVDALKREGIEADINSGRNDIAWRGRKISGNAQARKRRTMLHHGTLMMDARVGEMERYLRVPPERRDIPHTDFVTGLNDGRVKIDIDSILADSVNRWAGLFGCSGIIKEPPSSREMDRATGLVSSKYSLEGYNLKR